METDNTKTAIDTLDADYNRIGCTWDERGIIPASDLFAVPLPLR